MRGLYNDGGDAMLFFMVRRASHNALTDRLNIRFDLGEREKKKEHGGMLQVKQGKL